MIVKSGQQTLYNCLIYYSFRVPSMSYHSEVVFGRVHPAKQLFRGSSVDQGFKLLSVVLHSSLMCL